MLNNQISILTITILVTVSFSQVCYKETKFGDTKGLRLTEGLVLNYTTIEEAQKLAEIATSDQKKYFLYHSSFKTLAILSSCHYKQVQNASDLFFAELQDDNMEERRTDIDKILPNRYHCLYYKYFMGDHCYYSVGGYSFGVTEIFAVPKNKHPVHLAVKLRKMGEVMLGLLYSVEIMNNSSEGLKDLPSLAPLEVDDIGLNSVSTKRGFLEFNPANVIFRYQRSLRKYDVGTFKEQLKEFKIFDNMQNPDIKKIKCLNYFQVYFFWANRMREFFSYTSFKYVNCFEKKKARDPTIFVKCPSFFLMILDKLEPEEFGLLKNLSINIFEFEEELYKRTLFKVFMLMINLKSIMERRYKEEKLIYRNKKKEAKGDFNPLEEAFDNLFDQFQEIQASGQKFTVKESVTNESQMNQSQMNNSQTNNSQINNSVMTMKSHLITSQSEVIQSKKDKIVI